MPDGEVLTLPLTSEALALSELAGPLAGMALGLGALGVEVYQGLSSDLNNLNTSAAQLAAASVSDQVTAQQRALTDQQLTLTLHEVDAAQTQAVAEQQATQAERAQKIDTAAYINAITSASLTPDEVALRAGLLADQLALSAEAAKTLVDTATRTWEATKVKEQVEEAEAEGEAVATVAQVAASVGAAVPGLTTTEVAAPLTAASLASIAGVLANTFAQASHKQTQACMPTTGQTMLNTIGEIGSTALATLSLEKFGPLRSGLDTLFRTGWEMILGDPALAQPVTPEKAPEVSRALFSKAMELGMTAHLLSVVAESFAPLKNLGLGYLAAFLTDMAGFSKIGGAMMSALEANALVKPFGYYINNRVRSRLPNTRDLLEMFGEYAIPEALFTKMMGYEGWPDEWIPRMMELADRPLSTFQFRHLAEAGMLDEEVLDRELKNARYNKKTIPYLKDLLRRLAAGEIKGQFASAIITPYRYGYMDDVGLTMELDDLGYSGIQLAKALHAAKIDRAYTLAKKRHDIYLDQYAKDAIDIDDLRLVLATVIVDPDVLEAELEQAIINKYKPIAAAESPEDKALIRSIQAKYVQGYTQLFHKGYINEDTFYDYLLTARVDPDLAAATVMTEAAKLLPKAAS
jgi:hypothetical protein